MIIFSVFAFFGLGVAGIAEILFFNDLSLACSVGIGLVCGLLAVFGILLLNFADWPLILKDLRTGTCVEAIVACQSATRVRLEGSSLEGIALDCGSDTLVLIGDWWTNKTRADIWDDPESRRRFPARRFRIQFLASSGTVLFVEVFEGPLPIDDREPVEPTVTFDFTKYSEVVHVKRTFQSLVASRETGCSA